jgi:hypothetical protein
MLKLQSTLAAQIKQEEEKVKDSMTKMSESASSFGSVVGKVAGAAGAALAAMKIVDITKQALEMGDRITETSARMGMSTTTFQKWSYIAKESGANMDTLARGFKELAVKAEANDPIFKKLGISTRDEHGALKDTSDIMQEVVERLAQIQNPTERLAVAQKLLGRAAGDAMQMAALGAEKFGELAAESDKFSLTDEQLKSLHDANKSIERTGELLTIMAGQVVSLFAPAIEKVSGFIAKMAEDWKFLLFSKDETAEKRAQIEMIGVSIDMTRKKIAELKTQSFNFGAPGLQMVNPALTAAEEKLKDLEKQMRALIGVKAPETAKTAAPETAQTAGDVDPTKANPDKKLAEELIKLNEDTRHTIAQQNMNDDERELDDLKSKYSQMFQLAWKNGKDTTDIVKAYAGERSEVTSKQQRKSIEEEKKVTLETKKLAMDAHKHQIEEQKKYAVLMLKGTKTGFIHVAMAYQQDKAEFDTLLHGKLISQNQYDAALTKLQGEAMAGYAEITLSSLSSIAEATKANSQVKRRIAEGEAIISGGKAALGVIENSGQFISTFGPVAGPILMGVELAGIIAEAVVQVQKIESAKMKYGGVVTGGTPGQDSVPAMLMPGEVVYNPANPNSALASIIGSSTTNNAGNVHIHMGGAVSIQGSPSRGDLKTIQDHIDKGVTKALRRAQNLGKVNAPGLVIRS